MDVEAGFAMPGVAPSPHVGDGRRLTLRLAPLSELGPEPREGSERIAELRFDDGRLAVSVDADAGGYLMHALDFGHARLSADGTEALIAPLDNPDWVWQRYLTGQILPLAALLQGLEIFHACVLGMGDKAVAVVANSGVGKTTTALTLALGGLEFLSDDVLAVEARPENGVLAHPGIGLANVRPGAEELLRNVEEAGLASPVGRSERETRLAVSRSDRVLPLGALFVLTRFEEPHGLTVARLDPVDPRVLLACTFNLTIRSPERLTRQLDICSRIERTANVFRVACGSEVTPEEVARAVLQHAAEPAPC